MLHATPTSPLAAVTAVDPYPFYAALVADTPFYRDEALGMWVAASAAAVTAVLHEPALRTRPTAEPVPPGLASTAVGEVFGRLVRWNDGLPQVRAKRALALALEAVDGDTLAATSERCAALLTRRLRPNDDPDDLSAYAFAVHPAVMASLLGFADEAILAAAA